MAESLDGERFVRQILLLEIGAEGQTLIQRGSAAIAGDGLAAEIAIRYARCAGFGVVCEGAIDIDALAPVSVVASDHARAVVAGARATLAELRVALGRDRYAPRNDVPGLADESAEPRAEEAS